MSEQNEGKEPRLIISRWGRRVEAHGSEAIQAAMTESWRGYVFLFWWTLPGVISGVIGGLAILWN